MENRLFMLGIAAGAIGASVLAGTGMLLMSTFGGGTVPSAAPKLMAVAASTVAPAPSPTLAPGSVPSKALAAPPAAYVVREYPEKDAAGDTYIVQHWSDDHYSKRLAEKGQSPEPAPTPIPYVVREYPERDASGTTYHVQQWSDGHYTKTQVQSWEQVAPATPAPAPRAATCSALPQRGFGLVWSSYPETQTRLGCPVSPEQATDVAVERFQHGWMVWVSTSAPGVGPQIDALFDSDQTYAAFLDTWKEGSDPASGGETPPTGLVEPRRGFGKVWRMNSWVRQRLGWALQPETGGPGAWEPFQRGSMVWTPTPRLVIVLDNGTASTWRVYVDPLAG